MSPKGWTQGGSPREGCEGDRLTTPSCPRNEKEGLSTGETREGIEQKCASLSGRKTTSGL